MKDGDGARDYEEAKGKNTSIQWLNRIVSLRLSYCTGINFSSDQVDGTEIYMVVANAAFATARGFKEGR